MPAIFNSDDGHGKCSPRPSSKVLILSGTCASGKTTLSYLISERYGFVQVDGDWILKKWQIEQERKIHFTEINRYMLTMAEGLVFLGMSAVLAHVILPESLPLFERGLREKQIDYRVVILMPQKSALLFRNKHRKCWPNTTPEYWVTKFHRELLNAPESTKAHYYDNSHETAEQTAETIFRGMG